MCEISFCLLMLMFTVSVNETFDHDEVVFVKIVCAQLILRRCRSELVPCVVDLRERLSGHLHTRMSRKEVV